MLYVKYERSVALGTKKADRKVRALRPKPILYRGKSAYRESLLSKSLVSNLLQFAVRVRALNNGSVKRCGQRVAVF